MPETQHWSSTILQFFKKGKKSGHLKKIKFEKLLKPKQNENKK